jgi:hypothetical protein
MGKTELSCGGNFLRYLLFILNLLIFLMGLILFILTALLKWTKVLSGLGLGDFEIIINFASLSTVSTVVLIVAGIIMAISLFGLIGSKTMNRFFLTIYLILITILFLAHLIVLLVLVFGSSVLEDSYKKALNETVSNLKDKEGEDFTVMCTVLKKFSEEFKCCGAENGEQDFGNKTIVDECCNKEKDFKNGGCGQLSLDAVVKGSINFLVIPSAVILGIELFAIISVSCICGKRKRGDY